MGGKVLKLSEARILEKAKYSSNLRRSNVVFRFYDVQQLAKKVLYLSKSRGSERKNLHAEDSKIDVGSPFVSHACYGNNQ